MSRVCVTANIQNVSGLNTDRETSVPLVTGIVSNAWFHFSPHIKQTLLQIIDILHFCLTDFAELCPRFCSQLEWGHGCSVAIMP